MEKLLEHQQIEEMLSEFKRSKIKLVDDIDCTLHPFAPMNATFIGKYKYCLDECISDNDVVILKGHINIDNAHIFYKYIDDETKFRFRSNIQIAHWKRHEDIKAFLENEGLIFETEKGMDYDILTDNFDFKKINIEECAKKWISPKDFFINDTTVTYYQTVSYFGITDELSPIEDYITQIKNSDAFKKAKENSRKAS